MLTIYRIVVDGEVRGVFSADFAQATSPLLMDGNATPYRVADARHRPETAAELLLDWCDNQGGSIVGDGEEYDVVEGVRCGACGKVVSPEDLADVGEHNTGGETICLRCHREIVAADADLECPGCK